MKLFATIYLDADVALLVATLLQAQGFSATTTHAEGMLHADDDVQLKYAISLESCLVTHNRLDFERLHTQYVTQEHHHFGIIIATRRTPYKVANRIVAILNLHTADEIAGQLFYV